MIALFACALLACVGPPGVDPDACDPRLLDPGEVRARQMPCVGERLAGGEAARGDWVLENAVVRFAIRDAVGSLTQFGVAGGTLIDAGPVDGEDILAELIPADWPEDVSITATQADQWAAINVVWDDAAFEYRLPADSPTLWLSHADGLLVPREGTEVVGQTIERIEDDVVAAIPEITEDLGGWILYGGDRLTVGLRDVVYPRIFDTPVDGTGDGTWVEALNGDQVVARLPVEEGQFSGVVPGGSRLRTTQDGADPGPGKPAGTGVSLALGGLGSLVLDVHDPKGNPVPTTVVLEDGRTFSVPSPQDVPIGPYQGTLDLFSGPAYEVVHFNKVDITEDTRMDVVVTPVISEALADFSTLAWPDPTVRSPAAELAEQAQAQGVSYQVLMARDEVAVAQDDTVITQTGGFITNGGQGALIGWPASPETNLPGHGAPDWASLDPHALLAVASQAQERRVLVDATWVGAVQVAPRLWDPVPLGFTFNSIEELPIYTQLLDDWMPLVAIGPKSWLLNVGGPGQAELERAILAGNTVATNGPMIDLRAARHGPGDLIEVDAPQVTVSLEVVAPTWLDLTQAVLIGDGTVLGTWALDGSKPQRLAVSGVVERPDYLLAAAWGEQDSPWIAAPAFAVTSPIWLSRP